MYFTSFLAFLSNVFFLPDEGGKQYCFIKNQLFSDLCVKASSHFDFNLFVFEIWSPILFESISCHRFRLVLCGWNITNIMYKIMKLPFSYEGHFFHQDRFMLVKLSKPPFTFTFKALSGPVTPSFQLINFQKWVETQTWITKYSTNKEECRGDTRLR